MMMVIYERIYYQNIVVAVSTPLHNSSQLSCCIIIWNRKKTGKRQSRVNRQGARRRHVSDSSENRLFSNFVAYYMHAPALAHTMHFRTVDSEPSACRHDTTASGYRI